MYVTAGLSPLPVSCCPWLLLLLCHWVMDTFVEATVPAAFWWSADLLFAPKPIRTISGVFGIN